MLQLVPVGDEGDEEDADDGRHTAPSPPRMLVPPTTMPARTANVRLTSPVDAWALSTREASTTPASPAAAPLATKASTRIEFTGTPASRAARGLPPTAYMYRPTVARASTSPITTTETTMIQIDV